MKIHDGEKDYRTLFPVMKIERRGKRYRPASV